MMQPLENSRAVLFISSVQPSAIALARASRLHAQDLENYLDLQFAAPELRRIIQAITR